MRKIIVTLLYLCAVSMLWAGIFIMDFRHLDSSDCLLLMVSFVFAAEFIRNKNDGQNSTGESAVSGPKDV